MGERERNYRMVGAVYVIIGILLNLYFWSNRGVSQFLYLPWDLVDPNAFIGFLATFIIVLIMLVGSFVLALFGFVLFVRASAWFARVSCFLFCFLLVSFLLTFISNL